MARRKTKWERIVEVAAEHGWEATGTAMKVTLTKGPRIIRIDRRARAGRGSIFFSLDCIRAEVDWQDLGGERRLLGEPSALAATAISAWRDSEVTLRIEAKLQARVAHRRAGLKAAESELIHACGILAAFNSRDAFGRRQCASR